LTKSEEIVLLQLAMITSTC